MPWAGLDPNPGFARARLLVPSLAIFVSLYATEFQRLGITYENATALAASAVNLTANYQLTPSTGQQQRE